MPVTVRFDPAINSPQAQIIPNATEFNDGVMTSEQVAKLNGITPGAAVAAVTGTAPIVSSGGTSPDISITPATETDPGSMSAADKFKLDNLLKTTTLRFFTSPTALPGGSGLSALDPMPFTDAVSQGALWKANNEVIFAPGTYTWPASFRLFLPFGSVGGLATPTAWLGGFDSQIGTRTSDGATGANQAIDSTLTSIRSGSGATVTAAAGAGLARVMTVAGMSGLTAADVGKQFLFGLSPNAGNNGTFMMVSFISATSATFYNAQSVVDLTNPLYWQDSYELSFIQFTSGPAASVNSINSRRVRNHGTEATGSLTIAGVVTAGDTLTINDGTNAPTVFTWVAVVVAPTDVLIGADNNANAANLRTVINAQLPTALRVRATNTLGTAAVQLRNMLPGAVGNTATPTKTGVWTPTIVTFATAATGIGTPTTTFSVDEPFSPAPVAGNTFIVEKPNVVINYSGTTAMTSPVNTYLGMQGIKFNADAASGNMTLLGVNLHMDRCEWALNTRTVGVQNSSVFGIPSLWENDPLTVFPAARSPRYALHNGTLQLGLSRCLNRMGARQISIAIGANNTGVELTLQFLDAKRTTIFVDRSPSIIQLLAAAGFFARMDGALLATDTGIVKFSGKSLGLNVTQIDISNGPSWGIDIENDSYVNVGLVTGFGHVKTGLHFDHRSGGIIPTAPTTNEITGTLGNVEFFRFTVPNRQFYTTIRTPDANGERGYPTPTLDPTFAAYGCRLDA